MIYVTGDTHGGEAEDLEKLSAQKFKEGKNLTRNDYVIVAGDFGLVWWPNTHRRFKSEEFWRKWLDGKPWTTLFIDGNHENHDLLAELETVEKFGGPVGRLTENIYHLKRGEIYTIDDQKIFCFGGAQSQDKERRTVGIDWWPQEVPSHKEMERGLSNLEKHGNKVDYIVSHTCPRSVGIKYAGEDRLFSGKLADPTLDYLEHVINNVEFKMLYFGHWHDDWKFDKFRMLYDKVVPIGE